MMSKTRFVFISVFLEETNKKQRVVKHQLLLLLIFFLLELVELRLTYHD